MKIAILADPLDNQTAGIHIYTKEWVNALVAYDDENEYILVREKRDESIPFKQLVVPNIRLPIGFASFRLLVLIPLLLRWMKVDVVVEPAHFGPFNLSKRVKRVTVIHDLTPILFPQYHRWHSQWLQRVFLKSILKKADVILSNSNHTTQDIHRVYPFTKKKVSTIYLGKEAIYQPTKRNDFLKQKNIKAPYFLSVGTIEPRKNLTTLLEAFRIYKEEHLNQTKLVICGGKGWKSDRFYQVLEQHSFRQDIELLGFVEKEDLPELYSHAKALIYPSLYEGFGLPILEALSCGTLVIGSEVSSLPEVGGKVAYYFQKRNAAQLSQLMAKIMKMPKDERAKKVKEGLAWSSQFSWKKYVQEWKKVINQIN